MATNTSPSDVGPDLLIDDHQLIGTSLLRCLYAAGIDARLCGPSGGEPAILDTAARLPPHVVLLVPDVGRESTGQTGDGAALVAPLRAAGWRVVVLSGTADRA